MNRILCSTGAVIGRPNGRDYRLLGECMEKLTCDGFEFMMYEDWHKDLRGLLGFLKDLGAAFPVFHAEKSVGNLISRGEAGDVETAVAAFRSNCELAVELGSEKMVLHLWGGVDSDKEISRNIACFGTLDAVAREHGLLLTVENVVCNRKDPMTHLIALAEAYPDIRFTFDTKMARFHRQTDLLYEEENRYLFPRFAHFHINDYGGGYMDWGNLRTLHPGEGGVDFDRLFAFLKEQGYRGDFTVEATSFDSSGVIDFDKLNRTFEVLRGYLK